MASDTVTSRYARPSWHSEVVRTERRLLRSRATLPTEAETVNVAAQIREIGIELGNELVAAFELHPMPAFREDVEVRVRASRGDPEAAFQRNPSILAAVQHQRRDGDLLQFRFRD